MFTLKTGFGTFSRFSTQKNTIYTENASLLYRFLFRIKIPAMLFCHLKLILYFLHENTRQRNNTPLKNRNFRNFQHATRYLPLQTNFSTGKTFLSLSSWKLVGNQSAWTVLLRLSEERTSRWSLIGLLPKSVPMRSHPTSSIPAWVVLIKFEFQKKLEWNRK